MSRFLAFLLLVLLPIQSTLAISALYCTHDQGAGDTTALAAVQIAEIDGDTGSIKDKNNAPDKRCTCHHLSVPVAMTSNASAYTPELSGTAFHSFEIADLAAGIPYRPERPRWSAAV
jgi:hypothetical protein